MWMSHYTDSYINTTWSNPFNFVYCSYLCNLFNLVLLCTCRWLDPLDVEVGEVGRVKADDETRLIITNAQPEDTGNYSCVATNMAGSKKAQVWVVVSGKLPVSYTSCLLCFRFLSDAACRLSLGVNSTIDDNVNQTCDRYSYRV